MHITIVCDAKLVPPTFASTGAVRWTRRNVAMKGDVACEIKVRAFAMGLRKLRLLGSTMMMTSRIERVWAALPTFHKV